MNSQIIDCIDIAESFATVFVAYGHQVEKTIVIKVAPTDPKGAIAIGPEKLKPPPIVAIDGCPEG